MRLFGSGDGISPAELKELIKGSKPLVILDVRQPEERKLCEIPGSVLIPLPELRSRIGELNPDDRIVVYCHHGSRSASAVSFLKRNGFAKAQNLEGGIDAWSRQVDPGVRRY